MAEGIFDDIRFDCGGPRNTDADRETESYISWEPVVKGSLTETPQYLFLQMDSSECSRKKKEEPDL